MAKKLIHFAGYKFLPNLNPLEMFQLGVHGGSFFQHCSLQMKLTWDIDKRYRTAPKYDSNLNHFKVYPAKIELAEKFRVKSQKLDDVSIEWTEWYMRFYLGTRLDEDNQWIAIHRHVVGWANHKKDQALGNDDLTTAKKYGQLLMEFAMNPGFEPML